jgi:hypothetical protein
MAAARQGAVTAAVAEPGDGKNDAASDTMCVAENRMCLNGFEA